MRGDYTRLSFKPGNDYAGVRMQQGRVQLDADFNEQTELLERRLRAGSLDVLGRGAIPRETPDGFRIELSGMGLMIGRGRAYVDGLLAENHGSGEHPGYDRALAELYGSEPISYRHQPYCRDRPELPTAGTYLAYLDVWQRELTHLGEPNLVEKAVASDTSTRLQTVWQVGLVKAPQGAVCGEEIDAWKALTRPSAGRLTTKQVGVPVPDDPCTVPPAGGYRGTENRLYRVEIHDPGPLGKATFKWSRDNGSVASPVIGIDAARTSLTLVSLGRDGAQRLRPGDWVEVTDDHRELAGLPGEMRRVDEVEEETQTVKLATALPASAFDPAKSDRHTRIVRWDGSGPEVDAGGGLLRTNADPKEPLQLGEEGVEILFDAESAGEFRSGDWWAFTARAADALVEELVAEPPRGIHHHYLRLAVVDFTSGSVADCRTLWPPDAGAGGGCECTVCVSPEEHASGAMTIQMAVDRVTEIGGAKICLEPGVYPLEEPVRLRHALSVRIEGKGEETVLVPKRGLPALLVENSYRIVIEDLAVHTASAVPDREKAALVAGGLTGVAIALRESTDVTIANCHLTQIDPGESSGPLIGLLNLAYRIRIRGNALSGAAGIAGLVASGRGFAAAATGESLRAAAAAGHRLLVVDMGIEDNSVSCTQAGIALPAFTWSDGPIRIAGNTFNGCREAAVTVGGISGIRSSLEVAGNSISTSGDGIVVAVDNARIADNDVVDMGGDPVTERSGIALAKGVNPGGVDRCMVVGNRIVGRTGEGISIRALVKSASIEGNTIERVGGAGISMDRGASAVTLAVAHNKLLGIAPRVDHRGAAAGIRIAAAQQVSVLDNVVTGVGGEAVEGRLRFGIRLAECGDSRIAGNDVAGIGPERGFIGAGYGIGVIDPLAAVDVVDNSVCRHRTPPAQPNNDRWNTLAVLSHHPEEPGETDRPEVRAEVPGAGRILLAPEDDNDRMVVLRPHGLEHVSGPSRVAVTGNRLEAFGLPPCAVVWGSPSVVFAHNRCVLSGNTTQPVAWIYVPTPPFVIAAAALPPPPIATVVDGNHVTGPRGAPGLFMVVPEGSACTVLGNASSGPIQVNGGPLVQPWAALNVS
jgi:Family of unknown function (DUF6519)/Right handed beta helix region